MSYLLIAGLLLGSAGAAPGTTVDHRTQIDHPSGAVTVGYRGDIAIEHRQVGAVGPGGRPSSHGCAWSAKLNVVRHAVGASGASLTRSIDSAPVIRGTRPGWCGANRDAIAREVAARTDAMQRHLVALAQADTAVLRAELDAVHGARRAG